MRSLLIGMVVFDLFLHAWQWIMKSYFLTLHYYDLFWTSYWGIFLVFLIYELYFRRKQ